MKYKLYRAQYEMQFDENGEPLEWEDAFELVGVEYAQDVDRATPLLIKAITDELGTTPQYANCEVAAYSLTTLLWIYHHCGNRRWCDRHRLFL